MADMIKSLESSLSHAKPAPDTEILKTSQMYRDQETGLKRQAVLRRKNDGYDTYIRYSGGLEKENHSVKSEAIADYEAKVKQLKDAGELLHG